MSPSKLLQIARREFVATVMTRAFLIGLLVMPLMIGVLVVATPYLIQQQAPKVRGEIAVIDPGGQLVARLREQLVPAAFAERRQALQRRLSAVMPGATQGLPGTAPAPSLDQWLGEAPELSLQVLPDDTDLAAAKARLAGDGQQLALIVVAATALEAQASEAPYALYVRSKLDERLLDELREAMKTALIDARLSARQLDAREIRALIRTPQIPTIKVDASGEQRRNDIVSRLLPMAFMFLIFIAVMAAGQQLMTSTIEEKSSRVVELLLAAVSPTELMAGKIIGQLGVGLTMLVVYAGLGLVGLASFAVLGLLDPWLLLYLLLYFLIAYAILASLMAAIGAAVNELREAQTLLTPVMLVVALPLMLWMPISRAPDSLLAVVLSLLPPVSPFIMLLRLTSSTPPPAWQVAVSIVLGLLAVVAAMWFAGKVFRVGLLLHGKPPDFRTLLRWVRMA